MFFASLVTTLLKKRLMQGRHGWQNLFSRDHFVDCSAENTLVEIIKQNFAMSLVSWLFWA